MSIIRFDWLIVLYLFNLLPRNPSLLIVKNSGVREKLSDVNKSLCKNILLVSSPLCTPPLVSCTSPTDTLPFTYQPFNGPSMCAVDNFQRLIFSNSRSPDKFTGKRKTKIIFYVYIYILHHLRNQWHSLITQKVFTYHISTATLT